MGGGGIGGVGTGWFYYKNSGITYEGYQVIDMPNSDISAHFNTATAFIQKALNSGGKVLVHCLMGRSRSACLVLAYLILSCDMDIITAVNTVIPHRDVRPNDGFLLQLIQLDKNKRNIPTT